jgi:predicted ribosome quality control (RQC) complex YloA/Tae2 family protein
VEGLLIDDVLRQVDAALLNGRGDWRFVDRDTTVLPVGEAGELWIFSRLPNPGLEWRNASNIGRKQPQSPFQEQLVARANGVLTGVGQPALDRIATLSFAGSDGFVSQPPVALVLELTGRNGNQILIHEGRVVACQREVRQDVNRVRQIYPGVRYLPPPPYDKIDPRDATLEALTAALAGVPPKRVKSILDGIGPRLTQALCHATDVAENQPLEGESLQRFAAAVRVLVASPLEKARAWGAWDGVATQRRRLQRDALISQAERVLRERKRLLTRRTYDAQKTIDAEADAATLRHEADLLFANAAAKQTGEAAVTLQDFDGEERRIALDPRLSLPENANARYAQAKRREARAQHARGRLQGVTAELDEVDALLGRIADLDDSELKALLAEAEPNRSAAPQAAKGALSLVDPRGYRVWVGRNARENDRITFKMAKSKDVWLHAQGVEGAHVVVQAGGQPVPFETILYAAGLAAGHSKAKFESQVPVDYTLRKHVWRPKGAPPGAVHFAQQKTVFVKPTRRGDG